MWDLNSNRTHYIGEENIVLTTEARPSLWNISNIRDTDSKQKKFMDLKRGLGLHYPYDPAKDEDNLSYSSIYPFSTILNERKQLITIWLVWTFIHSRCRRLVSRNVIGINKANFTRCTRQVPVPEIYVRDKNKETMMWCRIESIMSKLKP